LLEPDGEATVGSSAVWFEPAPEDAKQPVPQQRHVFDGLEASAAAVGLGDMTTEQPVLFTSEEQDEDRRKFEHEEARTSK
jgi:NADH-quinone oxidoreductase subunit I